jgi:hypothetical protein
MACPAEKGHSLRSILSMGRSEPDPGDLTIFRVFATPSKYDRGGAAGGPCSYPQAPSLLFPAESGLPPIEVRGL